MQNFLLNLLSPGDLNLLQPNLTHVLLQKGTMLAGPNGPLEHVHFIESGLVSILASTGSEQIEVGLIGREGMTGLTSLLGSDEAVYESLVQIDGSSLCIEVDAFRGALDASRSLLRTLLRYAHVQLVQVAETAVANGRRTVEGRLARWLLMTHDRVQTDDIALTHEFLAAMLGVRRPGVTVALHVLEGERAIKATRGSVKIINRDRLKVFAGGCYGATEALYEKLLGKPVVA